MTPEDHRNLEEIALAYRSNHDVQWLLAEIARLTGDGAALREQLAERTAERDEYAFSLDQAMPGRTEMIRIVKAAVGELATARERLEDLRKYLMPEWFGLDVQKQMMRCMICHGWGPRDSFSHFNGCLLDAVLAPANVAPAAVSEDRK